VGGGSPTHPGQRASAALGTAAVAIPTAIEAVSVFNIRVSMNVGFAAFLYG
jgi:hypothetical protein